ncbi:hypothetical protein Hanom_Chr03g00214991 [Helianthus anomalus]
MKARHSFRTWRLLDVLKIYKAVEGLLLLASSPPPMDTGNEKPFSFVPSMVAGSDCKACWPKDIVDERVDVLSADDLMTHFPMIRKGGCQLVYRRRKNRRADQVPVVDDGFSAN